MPIEQCGDKGSEYAFQETSIRQLLHFRVSKSAHKWRGSVLGSDHDPVRTLASNYTAAIPAKNIGWKSFMSKPHYTGHRKSETAEHFHIACTEGQTHCWHIVLHERRDHQHTHIRGRQNLRSRRSICCMAPSRKFPTVAHCKPRHIQQSSWKHS